jgi:plasmid replication initiation protein
MYRLEKCSDRLNNARLVIDRRNGNAGASGHTGQTLFDGFRFDDAGVRNREPAHGETGALEFFALPRYRGVVDSTQN